MAKLHIANSFFHCCCFSPDGKLIAAAVGEVIHVWDISGPAPCFVETFTNNNITSLTFSSSSLISGSQNQLIKFWQISTLSTDSITSDLESTPSTSVSIQSITLQADDGVAISSDSAGVVKAWDILTGHCKVSFQTPAKGCHEFTSTSLLFHHEVNIPTLAINFTTLILKHFLYFILSS